MNSIVTVVNGSRARFFSLQPAEIPAYESSPRLVEHEELANPENESADKALWSDNSSGNRGSAGGGVHGYDDHRDQHRAEYERRFSQSVATEAIRLAHKQQAKSVVVVADSRMLGLLRNELQSNNDFAVKELARDYSKLSIQELHAQLASHQLIPAQRKPGE
ncbi:MAG: host attachment protein [Nitrosomonas sp.]|nr:host attachment protein [Nitrosomonas sp.]